MIEALLAYHSQTHLGVKSARPPNQQHEAIANCVASLALTGNENSSLSYLRLLPLITEIANKSLHQQSIQQAFSGTTARLTAELPLEQSASQPFSYAPSGERGRKSPKTRAGAKLERRGRLRIAAG